MLLPQIVSPRVVLSGVFLGALSFRKIFWDSQLVAEVVPEYSGIFLHCESLSVTVTLCQNGQPKHDASGGILLRTYHLF